MNAKPKKLLALAALTLALVAMPSKAPVFAEDNPISTQWEIVSVDTKTGKATIKWTDTGKTETRDATKVDDKSNVDPTCAKDGQYLYEVKIGTLTRQHTQVISKNTVAHTWNSYKTKVYDSENPNPCTDDYHTAIVCKVCGAYPKPGTTVEGPFDAPGHTWDTTKPIYSNVTTLYENGIVLVDGKYQRADAYSGGKYDVQYVCKVCGAKSNPETVTIMPEKVSAYETMELQNVAMKNIKAFVLKDGSLLETEKYDGEDVVDVLLEDCSKDGSYIVKSYGVNKNGTWQFVDQRTEDVKAVHHVEDPSLREIKWDKVKYPSLHMVNGRVVNDSCAVEGYYTVTKYCYNTDKNGKHHVISTDTVKVPVSENHSWMSPYELYKDGKITIFEAIRKGYVTTTGDCIKMGEETWAEKVCTVCGAKNGKTISKSGGKYGHENSGDKEFVAKKVDGVAPTAHHPGYYTSYTVCNSWGVQHDTTIVNMHPTSPDVFNYKYELRWYDNKAKADYNNNEVYLDKDILEEKPAAKVIAIPQDSDLTEEEREALTEAIYYEHSAYATVKEDKDLRVVGDAHTLGKRTYTATAKAGLLKPDVVLAYENYDDFVENCEDPDNIKVRYVSKTYADKDKKIVAASPAMTDTQAYKYSDGYKGEKEEEETTAAPKKSIKGAVIEGRITYRGEYSPIPYTVTLDGKKLKVNRDFEFTNTQGNTFKVVGPHKVTIKGIGEYKGEAKGKLYIDPAKQKIKVSLSKKTFKASALKKKAASFQITVTNNKGKVTYSLKKNNKKIVISKKGKVTLKKGLKAGKYQITVKAAATKSYKAASKTVTFTVK